jgi:hypothetical protein
MPVMRESDATWARQDVGIHYQGVDAAAQQMSMYLTTLPKGTERKTITFCFYDGLFGRNDHCLAGI